LSNAEMLVSLIIRANFLSYISSSNVLWLHVWPTWHCSSDFISAFAGVRHSKLILMESDLLDICTWHTVLLVNLWYDRPTMLIVYSFGGNDSRGASAVPFTLSVQLCNCSGSDRGQCLWDRLQDGFSNNDTFQIVECSCRLPLYDGRL